MVKGGCVGVSEVDKSWEVVDGWLLSVIGFSVNSVKAGVEDSVNGSCWVADVCEVGLVTLNGDEVDSSNGLVVCPLNGLAVLLSFKGLSAVVANTSVTDSEVEILIMKDLASIMSSTVQPWHN